MLLHSTCFQEQGQWLMNLSRGDVLLLLPWTRTSGVQDLSNKPQS